MKRGATMNNKIQIAVAGILCLVLFAPAAIAEEAASAKSVPLQSMSRAEYDAYREQLRQHENAAEAQQPDAAMAAEPAKTQTKRGGYGQGYRARAQHGGGQRNGMMNRGAMRR